MIINISYSFLSRSHNFESVPLEGRLVNGIVLGVNVGIQGLHLVGVSVERKHIARKAPTLHIGVHLWSFTDLLANFLVAELISWARLGFVEAESHTCRLKGVDHVRCINVRWLIVLLVILSAFCVVDRKSVFGAFWVGQGHLHSLVSGLEVLGGHRNGWARAVGFAIEGLVRVRFDWGCIFLIFHVTQILFLIQHTRVILGNLGLVAGHIVPIDLARAHVHLRLVKALAMLLLLGDCLTHDFRAI